MAKRQGVIEANRAKLKPNRGLGAIVHRPWWLGTLGFLNFLAVSLFFIGLVARPHKDSSVWLMLGFAMLPSLGWAVLLLVPAITRLGFTYRLEFPTLSIRRFGRKVATYTLQDFVNAKWLHKGKWFKACLLMPDGRRIRPSLPIGAIWHRANILQRFMETQDAPSSPEMEVAQRRLEYIAGEHEFDLVPGDRYAYGYTPGTIRTTAHYFLLFPVAVFIGGLPAWTAKDYLGIQSPVTWGFTFLGILLISSYTYSALTAGRRLELPRDEFEFDGEELVVYRDRVAKYQIPAPAWEPPQSPMKAVQDFRVNGRIYRVDRSALILGRAND